MLDKWFLQDIERTFKNRNRVVIIDEKQQIEFLLPFIQTKDYKVFCVNDSISELKTKYEIEKQYKSEKIVIYTSMPLEKLSFIREYCETEGRIIISFLHRYITEKVDNLLKLSLQPEELVIAGKMSLGKDFNFWKNISAKGISGIFENFEEEVISFITDPQSFDNKDKTIKQVFNELLCNYLNIPNIEKSSVTFATEITKKVFDNIVYNKDNHFLTKLYEKWMNSKKDFPFLLKKIEEYQIPQDIDIWDISPKHPFNKIDDEWIKEFSKNINNNAWTNSKSVLFRERANSVINSEINVDYWESVVILITFDAKRKIKINSLNDAIHFYTTEFYKVDTAIRNIYANFLNDREIVKPIQEYYENLLNKFLEKWFEYFADYKENQSELLFSLIKENPKPIAIIVGDGISYEIACSINDQLKGELNCSYGYTLGDFPSNTENNMSRLYLDKDDFEIDQSKRQSKLAANCQKELKFLYIDDVNYSSLYDHLIVISKDIDSLGEKFQQKALKYFNQVRDEITEKIKLLLSIGYKNVFLVSDHGFVLTGILEESDKIAVSLENTNFDKSERYICLVNALREVPGNLLQFEKPYKNFNFLVFSKNPRPFKTKGSYGYSHGGITPQELITPYFSFSKATEDIFSLPVVIKNKEELKEVIGDSFAVKLGTESKTGFIQSNSRKIILLFLKDGKPFYQSDIFDILIDTPITKEYSFTENKEFNLLVLDAATRENLDHAVVKQKEIRKINL